jgi:hypothetical protein
MATPGALPVWTLLLGGGHVLPWVLLPWAWLAGAPAAVTALAGLGVAANLLYRLLLAVRFRQHPLGVVLHPVAVTALLVLQWAALIRAARGRPAAWRGRTYPTG